MFWRYHSGRRIAEDAAAHAFAGLPEERKAEIMNPTKLARKKGHVWFKLIDAARGALKKVSTGPDYQRLFWHHESKTAHWMSADGDEEKHVKTIHRALKVPGVKKVTGDSESFPKGKGWVEIPVKRKKAKAGAKRYMKIEPKATRPGFEHISDFQVPVWLPRSNRVRVFTPHRLIDGQGPNEWHWDVSGPPVQYHGEDEARGDHPHLITWAEFAGGADTTMQLTPHEVYLATEGAEGHPDNPETAPFEMAIRKEPHESTHRGVYADYLDEQGRGEDAAKQRTIGEHVRGTKFSRRGVMTKYAKTPQSEGGRLDPEQVQIADTAHTTGDNTGWGALGDHLAENGFPNAGAVLSQVPIEGRVSHTSHLMDRTTYPPEDNTFVYSFVRDNTNVLHRLRLNANGTHHQFHWVVSPVRPRPEATQMSRRRLVTCR